MQMDNEVTHVGVIDRLLGLRFPDRIGGRIIGIQADHLDLIQILECVVFKIGQFATEHDVKQLRLYGFGHEHLPRMTTGRGLNHQTSGRINALQALIRRMKPKVLKERRVPVATGCRQYSMPHVGLVVNDGFARQGRHSSDSFVHD